jgi:hypothetical protein
MLCYVEYINRWVPPIVQMAKPDAPRISVGGSLRAGIRNPDGGG